MLPDDVVQVDLDSAAIVCDPELAASIRLPQKQYNKLYKAIAPFCRPAPGGDTGRAFNAAWAFPMAPPPDVEIDASPGSVSDMTDAEVAASARRVKAAFLRFFVSLTVRYQELMILPPSRCIPPFAPLGIVRPPPARGKPLPGICGEESQSGVSAILRLVDGSVSRVDDTAAFEVHFCFCPPRYIVRPPPGTW
jgi:hypothetical protein